jgi:hypothetical protein
MSVKPLSVVLSYLADSTLNKDAGIGSFLKSIISKIPGLPSVEEAAQIVKIYFKNNPEKFNAAVNEIAQKINMIPQSGKVAFDIKGIFQGLKALSDPKVIMAIIALMGAFNTADAGLLKKFLGQEQKQEQADPKQQIQDKASKTSIFLGKNEIADTFIKQNPDKMSGVIELNGKIYGIGIFMTPGVDFQNARSQADISAILSLTKQVKGTQELEKGTDAVGTVSERVVSPLPDGSNAILSIVEQ